MALTRVSYGPGQYQTRVLYGLDPTQYAQDVDDIYRKFFTNEFAHPQSGTLSVNMWETGLTPGTIYDVLRNHSLRNAPPPPLPGTAGYIPGPGGTSSNWNARDHASWDRVHTNAVNLAASQASYAAFMAKNKAEYAAQIASGARPAPIDQRLALQKKASPPPVYKSQPGDGASRPASAEPFRAALKPSPAVVVRQASLAPSSQAPVRAAALKPSSTVVRYASLPPSSTVTRTAALKPSSSVVRYASLQPAASSWSSISRYSTGRW